ncbi:MFS transporter [Amycolatopsis sp. WQ 127309]|uniref:MFS transporter n=1 Tax=Amycolatopsis sp. WQ 127309 TaxID=2932773 RepID=UPI001FF3C39A|nr:MFS transporter [Amycolatopsis sp. WQ 127309]UOZ06909.1 MFS transporter [Amycolatopsis sp. WQ 127309]
MRVPLGDQLLLVAACGAYLLVMMDYSVINVSLHTIQLRFGVTTAGLQWTVNAYEILFGTLILPAGFLADRYGHRRVLLGGLLLFALASAGIALSRGIGDLIAWRAVMGIGGAAIPATTLALVKNGPSTARTGRTIGVWAAMPGASFALGPVLGGALAGSGAWWAPFLVNIPVALGCALIVAWRGTDPVRARTTRLDWHGVLLVIGCCGTLLLGMSRAGGPEGWSDPAVAGFLGTSAALAAWLIRTSAKHQSPVLDLPLFRDRAFAAGTAAISLIFFALSGAIFLIPTYLQVLRGETALDAGLTMVSLAVGSMAASAAAGAVQAVAGRRVTGTSGMLAILAGLAGFAVMGETTPAPWAWCWFALMGIGLGLVSAVSTPLAMSSVAPDRAGTAAGSTTLVRTTSSAISVALLGTLCSFAGGADVAVLGEFRTAMWIAAGAASAGALVTVFFFPRKGSS